MSDPPKSSLIQGKEGGTDLFPSLSLLSQTYPSIIMNEAEQLLFEQPLPWYDI